MVPPGKPDREVSLVIFSLYLEICLRMCTDRANLRGFPAYADMSAVGALPYHVAVLGKYQVAVYIGKKLPISFFMFFFNLGYAFK